MGQRFTEEQLEQMIMQLEQGGLLQAPPSLERGVMEKIARLEEENQADIRFSSKTKRIFYQLKIGAAMAASLVLLALPMGHGSYEESPYGKAQQMVQEEEEKESLLDYMQQGTKILSDGVTGFSDFAMKRILDIYIFTDPRRWGNVYGLFQAGLEPYGAVCNCQYCSFFSGHRRADDFAAFDLVL